MAVTTDVFAPANSTPTQIRTYLGNDDKVNVEPIHDSQRDFSADQLNLLVAAVQQNTSRLRKGNLVKFSFYVADTPANQPATVMLPESEDTGKLLELLAWGGSVVCATVRCQNVCTAGVATIRVRKNGTNLTELTGTIPLVLNSTTATQKARAKQLPGAALAASEKFAALDELSVTWATDAAWAAGVTPSIWVDVYVSYGEEEDV